MPRRNPVVRRQPNGSFRIALSAEHRDAIDGLLGELEDLLEAAPDDPSLSRLHPPAYLDDPERDLGYQILAGDELRSNRRITIDAVRSSLAKPELSEADLWEWLPALNALRLVVGTRLGIRDEDEDRDVAPDHPDRPLWEAYDFATSVQWYVVKALGS